ncbi:hypothetical protein AMAG_12455 [Allomyces macrogynus ATCC 38327]|uniref:Homeobox domain-containing protein n=1 Tax=Allomyces macrogynus (strain ATCC 38327) TaxID=578462 RepID=A0A0L0SZG9_ALLM3|nr:hypothetical protein AMAG_12455 [Allomyces macrogynus ATCC 38327]|eukprot:KNE67724.1 hypothetical protein AMAG_12455 [Allomyces macrogynus ATCC 38327]
MTRRASHRGDERHGATVADAPAWGHGDAATASGTVHDRRDEDGPIGDVRGGTRASGAGTGATTTPPTESTTSTRDVLPLPPPPVPLSADHWSLAAVKNRRRRFNLPAEARATLLAWVDEHREHPYPTRAEKEGLVAATGLTLAQLGTWFVNHRRRSLKKGKAAHSSTVSPSVRDR